MNRTIQRARELRLRSTYPERQLWSVLSDRGLGGVKFRRQHPIGPYVADFFSDADRLVIEIDGWSHNDRGEYDMRRQKYFERSGLRVLRFSNDDVMRDLESVAEAILGACRSTGDDLDDVKSPSP